MPTKPQFVHFNGIEMALDWPTQIAHAQRQRTCLLDGKRWPRIPYGQEPCWEWDTPPTTPCRDCGVLPGQLHVAVCCIEQCPSAGHDTQRVSCYH